MMTQSYQEKRGQMYHLDETSIIVTSAYNYYWKFRRTSLAVTIYEHTYGPSIFYLIMPPFIDLESQQ